VVVVEFVGEYGVGLYDVYFVVQYEVVCFVRVVDYFVGCDL